MTPHPFVKPFRDRAEGGAALAQRLRSYADTIGVIVLALPRGGVPVAFEVATALGATLDVFLVRKLGAPGREELAIGAIASGGVRVLDLDLIRELRVGHAELQRVTEREQLELERRERVYRAERARLDLAGRTVILVDDGLATGASMRAAIRAVRQQHPARIVAAAPVGARQACEVLAREADEVVCAEMPEPFYGVGMWYEDFSQTSDADVQSLLHDADARRPRTRSVS